MVARYGNPTRYDAPVARTRMRGGWEGKGFSVSCQSPQNRNGALLTLQCLGVFINIFCGASPDFDASLQEISCAPFCVRLIWFGLLVHIGTFLRNTKLLFGLLNYIVLY